MSVEIKAYLFDIYNSSLKVGNPSKECTINNSLSLSDKITVSKPSYDEKIVCGTSNSKHRPRQGLGRHHQKEHFVNYFLTCYMLPGYDLRPVR
jgi:hypothetical protein